MPKQVERRMKGEGRRKTCFEESCIKLLLKESSLAPR